MVTATSSVHWHIMQYLFSNLFIHLSYLYIYISLGSCCIHVYLHRICRYIDSWAVSLKCICWSPNPQLKGNLQVGIQFNLTDVLLIRRHYDTQRDKQGCAPQRKPCEDTARRRPSANQGGELRKKPNRPILWSRTSNLRSCEKIRFCRLCHPGCAILLWPPRETNTVGALVCACVCLYIFICI